LSGPLKGDIPRGNIAQQSAPLDDREEFGFNDRYAAI
jgi:hypothetical protein